MTDEDPQGLYAELGVGKGATTEEVRQAYRRRSKKTHPNAGGDRDAFERTHTALVVLSDPRRRERYDRDGVVDDERPENAHRGAAIGMIDEFIERQINDYAASNFQKPDPCWSDLLAAFRNECAEQIKQARTAIGAAKGKQAYLRKLASRFRRVRGAKGADVVALGFRRRLDACEAAVRTAEDIITAREIAIELSRQYVFDVEVPFGYGAEVGFVRMVTSTGGAT